tara:strand:- start:621 stop:839 length:219 start_codon:yes stop_codon:yes gene_type:complete
MASDAEILADIKTAISDIVSTGGRTKLSINGRSSEYDLAGLESLLQRFDAKSATTGGVLPIQQHRIIKGGGF